MKKSEVKSIYKKSLCILLSVVTAFGAIVTLVAGSSGLSEKLNLNAMLSAYASQLVDTECAVGVNEESMLADRNVIDLKNEDGTNTLYLFSEPISFTDKNGNLKTKDISVEKQPNKVMKSEGYDYANGQNDYRINFSKDISKGLLVEFEGGSYSIVPQTEYKSSEGKESISVQLNEKFETFEYSGAYGAGTKLKFYPQLNGIKDEIVLDSNIEKNTFSFELNTENCTAVLNDDGTVSLVGNKDESAVQTFSAPYAYDSEYIEGDRNEHYTSCVYSLDKKSDNSYVLTINVDRNWLEKDSTVYPVIIDPATSKIGNMYDLPIHKNRTSTGATVDVNAVGLSDEHVKSYSLIKFQKPSEIKGYATINSAYFWSRELTGRTSTFKCGLHKITSSWNENTVWSTRPTYNSALVTSRNINSKSTDVADNPYWYKFNIKSLVQEWYTGTTNYGFLLKYESDSTANNLRTFAHLEYSTSSWRPYTVINYTNDTTAPTLSVTKSTTAWTNGAVKLTASATDSASGLHANPYSFSNSTTASWSATTEKSYSTNAKVYVSARDKAGNSTTKTISIANIDKLKPGTPTYTGYDGKWTNKNVTLTANSTDQAKTDSYGCSGIGHYSFSTAENSYSWQTANSKTFSAKTSVFIYSKDNAGNISAAKKVDIKIDKTAPTVPTITGYTEDWKSDDITITATSTDDASGISQYSFSREQGKYNWQNTNTYTASDASTLYVCAKDNAGNISAPKVINLKIDKIAPTGSANADNSTDWATSVRLTADASDDLAGSGLHSRPYSFSSDENSKSWQADNTCTVTRNGTYYIHARDVANNIVFLDTVVVNNIDDNKPYVRNIDTRDEDGKTIITITAEDSQSGVGKYSIDNGKTWQESNVFEIEKNSLNYIAVKVEDNVGHISSNTKYYDFVKPELYYEDNGARVGIYNPNPNCKDYTIYYKTDINSEWFKYTKPFDNTDELTELYVSFYIYIGNDIKPIEVSEAYYNTLAYKETATDFTFTYNNVSLDIGRMYYFTSWVNLYEYSFDDYYRDKYIEVMLDDYNMYTFLKQDKYTYFNESKGYTLTVVYDESDENIIEYIVHANGINYHFNIEIGMGMISKMSNADGDLFEFEFLEYETIIRDNSGRTVEIDYSDYIENQKVYIIDPSGNIITHIYENHNLKTVIDQAGTIIGKYEYDGDKLVKSGHKNLKYDSKGRVVECLMDSGYSTAYTYSDNSVTSETVDGITSEIVYDEFGKIVSSTDNNGSVTEYSYYNNQKISKIVKDGEVVSAFTYVDDVLIWSDDADGVRTFYDYDSEDRLIREKSKNSCVHYVYDSNDRIVLKASVKEDSLAEYKYVYYNENENCYDIIRYNYGANGFLESVVDETKNTTTCYAYDGYGNTVSETVKETDTNAVKSITTSTYDLLGRMLTQKNGNSETVYTYDDAGRLLLSKADGVYNRTVYDNYGRVVQEIDNEDYNPASDSLPNDYSDKTVGHRYYYNTAGDLAREINKYNIETTYDYSSAGTIEHKSFDMYDYYYLIDGRYDKVLVNGETIVDYDYNADTARELEEGQYADTVSYANGDFDETVYYDNGAVCKKFTNHSEKPYYSLGTDINKKTSYHNQETRHSYHVNQKDGITTYEKNRAVTASGCYLAWNYKTYTENDVTTVEETYFNSHSHKTVYSEDSVKYISENANLTYTADSGENNTAVEKISNGDTTVLSTAISYDEDTKTYRKSYAGKDYTFRNVYDDNGYISSDDISSYEYDKYGELIKTTGRQNASYTYDGRGNILTKTVDGETTSFAYDSLWKDQLTAVNDQAITYDANGNMLTYGDVQYSWTHGKMLSEITDGENTYEYKYDTNGIRGEKVINGQRTIINSLNGTVFSQHDIDNNNVMYFQYSAGTPLGFQLNDVQYLYITNLSGDVVGITDLDGNVLAEYAYDEWGKLLEITADSDENKALAELNPLRYRGYYYDNETGMYYLQSRYYSPDLCRFISADDFSYITSSGKFAVNAYAYCANNPVSYSDPTGYKKVNNDSPTYLAESVADIIMSLIIYGDLSEQMISLLGFDITLDFFTLLGGVFSLLPSSARLILDIIKEVPSYIWEVLEENVRDNVSIENIIKDLCTAFYNSILTMATEVPFFELFATWGIGIFPVELAVLIPGIILDEGLTPSEKLTLILVDSISILLSNAISIAISAFDVSGVLKVIGTIASVLLPVLTDLIAKFIIKKE